MCWHASFYFLCVHVYSVILMWKPFYFIFIDFVYKLRNGSFYHDCCKFAEIFFSCLFSCVFFPDVFYLRHGDASMSIMLVCHGSLSCSYMAFVPFHCLLLLDIFAQFFFILFKIYKYILYPMLSYRFIADTAIFSAVLQIICFLFSAKKKNIL